MLGYVYMHDMGWGWAILMTIAWLAILGLLVGVVLAAVRDRRSPSPREILDHRLAAGEIDLDEYERARRDVARGHGRLADRPTDCGLRQRTGTRRPPIDVVPKVGGAQDRRWAEAGSSVAASGRRDGVRVLTISRARVLEFGRAWRGRYTQ